MAETVGKIYGAIIAVMGDMTAISKDRRNQQQGYAFRGIEDMYNAFHPLFAKHGIFSVPRVVSRTEETYENKNGTRMIRVILSVEYDFVASDGSSIPVGPIFAEAMDSGDKATNKALSVAHKYAFIQLFAVPTEDLEDTDLVSPGLPPEKEKKTAIVPAIPAKVEAQQVKKAEAKKAMPNRAEHIQAMAEGKWTQDQAKAWAQEMYGVKSTADLSDAQYKELCETFRGFTYQQAREMNAKHQAAKN